MEFNFKELIETYRSPDVIEVQLKENGMTCKFNSIKSHADLVAFKKRRETFQKVVSTKSKLEGWEDLTPIPSETATKVFTVTELSVEPKFTQIQGLEMAKYAPFLLEHLFSELEENSIAYRQQQAAKALEEGKEE